VSSKRGNPTSYTADSTADGEGQRQARPSRGATERDDDAVLHAAVDGDDSDEAGCGKAAASTIGASVRGRRRRAIVRRKVFMVSRIIGPLPLCSEP
jgi:hypothetical protein